VRVPYRRPDIRSCLGELAPSQCRALADETRDLDYPGVVGPDRTAQWFAQRAIELGLTFLEPIPQQIHLLTDKPNYPGVPGDARVIGPADVELFADWTIAFLREAVPHDPLPSRERLAQIAAEGRHQFWIVDDEPVSMAGIVRRTRHAAAIAGVYTPPALRGRGYAGSVTAAVVERIFAEGKIAACLYTDLRRDRAESDALIAELKGYMIQPDAEYRHKWRKGDIVIWDSGTTAARITKPPETTRRRKTASTGGSRSTITV
jgi:predicted GNAT family acetyltransferase